MRELSETSYLSYMMKLRSRKEHNDVDERVQYLQISPHQLVKWIDQLFLPVLGASRLSFLALWKVSNRIYPSDV